MRSVDSSSDDEHHPAANSGSGSGRGGSGNGGGARCRRKQTTSRAKSTTTRRDLPPGAVSTLRAWMLSEEHFNHPYPTPQDQVVLMQTTGIDKKQLKNWFTNARRRIWKPLLEKKKEAQREMGIVPVSPITTGNNNGHSAQVAPMPSLGGQIEACGKQQQQQPRRVASGSSRNKPYQQALLEPQQPIAPASQQQAGGGQQYGQQYSSSAYYQSPPDPMMTEDPMQMTEDDPMQMIPSNSIGSLPPPVSSSSDDNDAMGSEQDGGGGILRPMSKTDSQAMLMELFQRDQDLVRQATEGARLKAAQAQAQADGANPGLHPMMAGSSGSNNPSFTNSWPHFSSVNSLNNLGGLTGVKSIGTNMGGVSPVGSNQNLRGMSALAHVKSIENMGGRTDSYARFMGVFFDDCIGGIDPMSVTSQGLKRDRAADEDNDVGLSLDAAEATFKRKPAQVGSA